MLSGGAPPYRYCHYGLFAVSANTLADSGKHNIHYNTKNKYTTCKEIY